MDGKHFDELVKGMGTGRSRRSVLKGAIGGAAALIASRASAGLAKNQDRYEICHRKGNGAYNSITVAARAVDAHLAHGDGILGSDDHCGSCGNACFEGESCIDGLCTPDGPQGCSLGYEPNESGDTCYSCVPGSASPDGLACVPCAVDTYAANTAQAACDACAVGYSTNGETGATACEPIESGGFICESADQCQQWCPGSVYEDFCYCSTIYESGEPVCYRSGNGCASGAYCDTNDDCPDEQVCLNLNLGCGGCDDFTLGRGICNSIC